VSQRRQTQHPRRPGKGKSLLEREPAIAREWHPTRNGSISAKDVSSGSNWQAWWKCRRGPDHEWKQIVSDRLKNRASCPFCRGHKVSVTNALPNVAPHLLRDWHVVRNGRLKPNDFAACSDRPVWWQCKVASDHVWRAPIGSRAIRGQGCPYCNHAATVPSTSLAMKAPKLASQWHPTRNGKLRADQVALRSARLVWWKCPKADDHEWQAQVKSRSRKLPKIGCPFCASKILCASNSLAARYPLVAAEWHPKHNGKTTPSDVLAGSTKKYWWVCRRKHVWRAILGARTRQGQGCQKCWIILRYGAPAVMTFKPRRRVMLPSDWE
jgi:Probable Zinc-ribbon domain